MDTFGKMRPAFAWFATPRMLTAVGGLAVVGAASLFFFGIQEAAFVALALAALSALISLYRIWTELRVITRETLDAHDQLTSLQSQIRELSRLDDSLEQIARRLSAHPGGVRAMLRADIARDTAALFQLHGAIGLPGEHVPLTTYSALPSTVLLLAEQSRRVPENGLILELGSGTSTLWIAAALEAGDATARLVSIDHDAEWAVNTRRALESNGLSERVDLRIAPIVARDDLPSAPRWYAASAFEDVQGVDLLFVDGPPGNTSHMARRPAIDQLAARLSKSCIVVLDDTNRTDERAQVEHWLQALGDGARVERRIERTTVIARG